MTPDPFLGEESPNSRVTATFIVGTDGRVHSALILKGGGQQDEQSVLDVVRFWRYRPRAVRWGAIRRRGRGQVFQSMTTDQGQVLSALQACPTLRNVTRCTSSFKNGALSRR